MDPPVARGGQDRVDAEGNSLAAQRPDLVQDEGFRDPREQLRELGEVSDRVSGVRRRRGRPGKATVPLGVRDSLESGRSNFTRQVSIAVGKRTPVYVPGIR